MDRPSRFLVRGASIPEDQALNNETVLALCNALTEAKTVFYGPRQIRFVPKMSLANDIYSVRSCQCVGYTNVAGASRSRVVAPSVEERAVRREATPPSIKERREEGGEE
ncbi:MAG: hypothetical protein ABEI13_03745 [Candidatus Paceibacteria bacterium]